MSVATTREQREILRHALGLDPSGKDPRQGQRKAPLEPYRNHYCTHDGDPKLEALVTLGLMERGRRLNDGRDRYYHVTEAGKAEAAP